MRFSLVTVFAAAFAGLALAAPAPANIPSATDLQQRGGPDLSDGLILELTSIVGKLLSGLHVDKIESQLDKLLGGALSKLEEKLGLSFAEYLLGLQKNGAKPGLVQAIGNAVGRLLKGLGLDEVNKLLSAETGGVVSDLEKFLGIPKLVEALGLGDNYN